MVRYLVLTKLSETIFLAFHQNIMYKDNAPEDGTRNNLWVF